MPACLLTPTRPQHRENRRPVSLRRRLDDPSHHGGLGCRHAGDAELHRPEIPRQRPQQQRCDGSDGVQQRGSSSANDPVPRRLPRALRRRRHRRKSPAADPAPSRTPQRGGCSSRLVRVTGEATVNWRSNHDLIDPSSSNDTGSGTVRGGVPPPPYNNNDNNNNK